MISLIEQLRQAWLARAAALRATGLGIIDAAEEYFWLKARLTAGIENQHSLPARSAA
jgi:hypothetical protein